MSSPTVSIIILNWNGLSDTINCLESLKNVDYTPFDIVVVDNGSGGNDAVVLKEKYGSYIHLIRSSRNLGYAGGVNLGINYVREHLHSDYILLLNNDTLVDPRFLRPLVDAFGNEPATGIAGPKVYYYDYPNRMQSAGNTVDMYRGCVNLIGNKQVDEGQYDHMKNVDFFGPCMLISRRVIQEVGLLDEDYFCYWEDVDYCMRVKRSRYKITYVPDSRIWHCTPVKLRTGDKEPEKSKISTIFPYYYIARNSWIFMRKYASSLQFTFFCLYFFTINFAIMTYASLFYHHNLKLLQAFVQGARDGLKGIKGNTFRQ